MDVLLDLFGSLLETISLVGLSMAFGGLAWTFLVLPRTGVAPGARRRATHVVAAGAFALALSQALALLIHALLVRRDLGPGALPVLLATPHFLAGMARAGLALGLGLAAVAARAGIFSPTVRPLAVVLALLAVATSPWLTHAAGRLEHRSFLMTFTALHQAATALWLGGLVQLGALWRLGRRDPAADAMWAAALGRFSRVALVTVGAAVATGVPLVWRYEGSWNALVGSAHGSLVLLKTLLLAAVLLLAALNRKAARRMGAPGIRTWVPSLIEGEIVLLVMILVTAAGLSAQTPGVDAPQSQASWREVVELFRPKWPTVTTPSREAVEQAHARQTTADGNSPPTFEGLHWSNFNHNVSGLILLGVSLFALIGSVTGKRWAQHWPLGFVALAVFVFLREAMGTGVWPFAHVRARPPDAEVLQHWAASGLVLALGLLEWRARAAPAARLLPYLFPALAAAGGALLLTHSHETFELKTDFLIQVTHSAMGAFAALVAAARWLELRLPPRPARAAGIAAHLAMVAIALVLVFYREANIVIPPSS